MWITLIGRFLWGFLVWVGPYAWRVLAVLGIGFVSYQGLSAVFDVSTDFVMDRYTGIPSDLLAICDRAGIRSGLVIYLSALTAAAGVKAASIGKRMVFK